MQVFYPGHNACANTALTLSKEGLNHVPQKLLTRTLVADQRAKQLLNSVYAKCKIIKDLTRYPCMRCTMHKLSRVLCHLGL